MDRMMKRGVAAVALFVAVGISVSVFTYYGWRLGALVALGEALAVLWSELTE
jgi:hypothetical protein